MENDAYYLAELEDKILNQVYSFMRDVPRPFGVLLSGGFDSGLLAALTKPDYVYSVRFPYGIQYDESRYADAIIDHLHLRDITTIIIPKKEDFERYFEPAVLAMGEPVSHFSLIPFYMTMKFISEKEGNNICPSCGNKVKEATACSDHNCYDAIHVISGEGPDEYLGGYARQIIFDELAKLYKIPELRNYHRMIDKVIGKETISAKKYGEVVGYSIDKVQSWIIDHQEYFESNEMPIQGIIGKMDMELGVIEKMEQKMAKANKINLHYPYINEDFAEYCYRLPDHLKIRNGVTKWAFRQICKKYLPEFMWDRAKMGGPVAPVNEWLGLGGGFDKTEYIKRQEEILNANTRNR